MSLAGDAEWRHIFYIGGIAPILLIPLIMRFYQSQMTTCNEKFKRKNDTILGSFICQKNVVCQPFSFGSVFLYASRTVFLVELVTVADGCARPIKTTGKLCTDGLQRWRNFRFNPHGRIA